MIIHTRTPGFDVEGAFRRHLERRLRAEATDSDIVVALGRALALAKRSLRRDRQRGRRLAAQA